MIKKFNKFLNEKAVSAEDVLANEPNTGAIRINRKKAGGKQVIEIVLFNFENRRVEGLLEVEKEKNDNIWMITKSYAIDKHGPLMYEFGLSETSPEGIIPDRVIKPKAQNVWKYFNTQRSDVKKTDLASDNRWFTDEYDADLEHEHLKDPETLKILNTIYSVDKKMNHVDELLRRGEELMKSYKIKPTLISMKAYSEFWAVYLRD